MNCKQCQSEMTWTQARGQYGRMLARGLSQADAKNFSPRCPTCTTKFLREKAKVESV